MSEMKEGSVAANPTGVYCALVLISFLNYTDRAILPGSANEFLQLISSTLSTDRPDIYLGILQSSFIIGFSFASIIVGHLVHFRGPFYLCAAGLGLWVASTILSGVGFYLDSFVLLLIGRMMSGIGEASFVCIAPPWIAKYAPDGRKGRWLAIFYTALPVGTAFGYSYAAFIANSLGVHWAFFMESIAMLPLIAILLSFAPHYPSCPSSHGKPDEQVELSTAPTSHLNIAATDLSVDSSVLNPIQEIPELAETQNQITEITSSTIVKNNEVLVNSSHDMEAPTMLEELYMVSSSPSYICITAGNAAQAAVLCGLGTFGSAFLMGLGYFDSETAASSTFGSVVCLAGIVGTPLGGLLLDYNMSGYKDESIDSENERCLEAAVGDDHTTIQKNIDVKASRNALKCATKMITFGTLLGTIFLCSVYAVYNRALFLVLVTLGCLFVFLCSPGVNIGIMSAVPEENRSFAIALTSVCIHIFGDVPSPIITGLLKDLLAPRCAPTPNHSPTLYTALFYTGDSASSECRADGKGLRLTMLIVSLWLFASVFFFGAAWYFAHATETPKLQHEVARDIKEVKKEKTMQKAFQSKKAYSRLQLQEPLLCIDEEGN